MTCSKLDSSLLGHLQPITSNFTLRWGYYFSVNQLNLTTQRNIFLSLHNYNIISYLV